MLCYKDKIFCPFWNECEKGDNCSYVLNENVIKGSKEIGLPIAQYVDKPECFELRSTLCDICGEEKCICGVCHYCDTSEDAVWNC